MKRKLIYLDNAATTWPKPEVVYKTMDRFFRLYGANPGRGSHRMAIEAERIVEGTRFTLARFFGLKDYKRLVFTFNCTDALNMAIKGLLKKGDHVITSTIEHNSVSRPLYRMEKEGIIEVSKISSDDDGFIDVREAEKAVRSTTRLLVLTHASNVLGTIQHIRDFGKLCRKKNIVFLLDAAQTAGVIPINMEIDNIDILAFSGHKSLFGPPGTGGLCVGNRVSLEYWREGGSGKDSRSPLHPDVYPERLEGGTINFVGIAGLNAGINFILKEGIGSIRKHEVKLVSSLIDRLKRNQKITLYGTREPAKRVGLISLTVNDSRWDSPSIGSFLDESSGILLRTGHHCARDVLEDKKEASLGTIRISPGYFNTDKEVDLVCKKIEEAIA